MIILGGDFGQEGMLPQTSIRQLHLHVSIHSVSCKIPVDAEFFLN